MSFDIQSDQLQLHALELKQSDTDKMHEYSAKLELNQTESMNSHLLLNIMQMIKDAKCLADLTPIITAINPLQELKQLLLDKVKKLHRNSNRNSVVTNRNSLSLSFSEHKNINGKRHKKHFSQILLNELYFKVIPMDEILSDDIICSIISYISGSNMYNKIPCINKHFNFIMKNYPILFQNYTMKLPLHCNKALNVFVSHKLRLVELSTNKNEKFIKKDKYALTFVINSIEEMNKYCPFMWDQINKWYFILNNDINYIKQCDSKWKQLIHQIITQSNQYILSAKIVTNSNAISNSLSVSLLSHLQNLTHIYFPSNNTFINSFINYSIQCNQILSNILYLDMITIDANICKIIKNLNKLLVLKIQFDESETVSDNNTSPLSQGLSVIDDMKIDSISNGMNTIGRIQMQKSMFVPKKQIIEIPKHIEFIGINGFHFGHSEYILNFKQCINIIGVSFNNSQFESWMCDTTTDNNLLKITIDNQILWNYMNDIQCILLDEVSNDFEGIWWRYFKSFNDNNTCPKIKYLRYCSQPRLTKTNVINTIGMDGVSDNNDTRGDRTDSVSIMSPVLKLNKSEKILETVSVENNKPKIEISVSSISVSNGSTIYIPTPQDIIINNPYAQLNPKEYHMPLFKSQLISINKIGENNDRNMLILSDENNDGCLWKLLLKNKYKNYNNGQHIINEKIRSKIFI